MLLTLVFAATIRKIGNADDGGDIMEQGVAVPRMRAHTNCERFVRLTAVPAPTVRLISQVILQLRLPSSFSCQIRRL